MNRNLWLSVAVAVLLVAVAAIFYMLDISYVLAVQMFIAAVVVLGISMSLEDVLFGKYTTPRDEDSHTPQLNALRAIRAITTNAMETSIFRTVY